MRDGVNVAEPVENQEHKPGTYESLRDEMEGISAPVRTRWQAADKGAANLLSIYGSLQADSDLTDEARSRKASEHYERHAPGVEEGWATTRAELRGAAKALVEASTPRPSGQKLAATTNEEILVAQGERERILRTIERRKAAGGPFKANATDHLKAEYQRGLATGGALGAAICRGVLDAGRELGVPEETWIAPLRDDQQRANLDRARRVEQASYAVPSRAPRPGAALNSGVRSEASGIFQPRQVHLSQQPSNLSSRDEAPHPFQRKAPQRSQWK
jgi:hypothetical protein